MASVGAAGMGLEELLPTRTLTWLIIAGSWLGAQLWMFVRGLVVGREGVLNFIPCMSSQGCLGFLTPWWLGPSTNISKDRKWKLPVI